VTSGNSAESVVILRFVFWGIMMETAARDQGAFGEVVVFLSHFKTLDDPRQAGKVLHPLDEVLLLCLLNFTVS
jgi:hypothetical protein